MLIVHEEGTFLGCENLNFMVPYFNLGLSLAWLRLKFGLFDIYQTKISPFQVVSLR